MVWSSTLARDISALETTLPLAAAPSASLYGATLFVIDPDGNGEIVAAYGIGGSTIFVQRGALGTTPASHVSGSTVQRYAAPTSTNGGSHPDLATHVTLGLSANDHTHPGGSHPDLATHNTLGLATQGELDAHEAAADPHTAYALDSDLTAHTGAADPHAGYQRESEKGLANGYAGLDAGGAVPDAQLPASLARDAEVAAAYSALGHSHPGGAEIPAGVIVMWGGLVANIPAGWILCDGQNGTPDLRDRFIKGATGDPGATGGAATHTHAAHTGVINHTHPVTDPGHTHLTQRYPTATGGSSGFTNDTSMSGTLADNTLPTKTATTGVTTTNPAGGVASLTHDSPSNEPPYFALCFIQKSA